MAEPKPIAVIFAHPALERARVAPALMGAAAELPSVELRDLYELYPDFMVDVEAERQALRAAEAVVLQFPLYWYSGPALLKEWLDVVLTNGFAYGERGGALRGKRLACVVSAAGGGSAFQPKGHSRFTMAEFLRPYEQTAKVCEMHWAPPFVVHAAARLSERQLGQEASRYRTYLEDLF
jgi:glutathione-regulated potassium-efflux system ancillary protein KefG